MNVQKLKRILNKDMLNMLLPQLTNLISYTIQDIKKMINKN